MLVEDRARLGEERSRNKISSEEAHVEVGKKSDAWLRCKTVSIKKQMMRGLTSKIDLDRLWGKGSRAASTTKTGPLNDDGC